MMKEYWAGPRPVPETIKNGYLYTVIWPAWTRRAFFILVDRARDMYITGGENVYTAETERVLKEHPEIEDAAVIGIPDDSWGEIGHAFIIRVSGARIGTDDIIAFCKQRLAAFKCPQKNHLL